MAGYKELFVMSDFKLTTPVMLCIFKRMDTTKKVFAKIREAKPAKLYIVSDAARDNVENEIKRVAAVRDYVEQHIDWDCEVHKNYATSNMGCGNRMQSGISWVFEHEEQAIILEDDCEPDSSFFRYCQEMLEYYKDDEKVLMVSGNNPIGNLYQSEHEYFFSHVPFLWGWASWRRSWKLFDYRLESWKDNKNNPLIRQAFPTRNAYWYYTAEFDNLSTGKYNDVWDYQFMYAGIINNMLCIVPSRSHVRNVGFSEESTHTDSIPDWLDCGMEPVRFPINYRKDIIWEKEFDIKYMSFATKHAKTVKIKSMLGMDVNASILDSLRRR
jgi:hypothetical protein